MCIICDFETRRFLERRSIVLGAAAALLSGRAARIAAAEKPLQVGGLPVT